MRGRPVWACRYVAVTPPVLLPVGRSRTQGLATDQGSRSALRARLILFRFVLGHRVLDRGLCPHLASFGPGPVQCRAIGVEPHLGDGCLVLLALVRGHTGARRFAQGFGGAEQTGDANPIASCQRQEREALELVCDRAAIAHVLPDADRLSIGRFGLIKRAAAASNVRQLGLGDELEPPVAQATGPLYPLGEPPARVGPAALEAGDGRSRAYRGGRTIPYRVNPSTSAWPTTWNPRFA